MKNNKKTNKGFTLIELIISIAIASIIVAIAYNLLNSNNKLYARISKEFDIQSQVRYATEVINNKTRYSTVAFAVLEEHFNGGEGDKDGLTEKWNYFGVSKDRQELVFYKWDGDKHKKEVLIPKKEGFYYDLYFYQKKESENERIISYELLVTKENRDKDEQEIIEIKTDIEALSAIQIVDRGLHSGEKAVALAYRTDPTPKAEEQHSLITMVLDTSGSMDWHMGGEDETEVYWSEVHGDLRLNGQQQKVGDPAKDSQGKWLNTNMWYYNRRSSPNEMYPSQSRPSKYSGLGKVGEDLNKKRINILKNQSKFLVEEFQNKKIKGSLRLIPFSTVANYQTDWLDIQTWTDKENRKISGLTATGGTNTGDGLRLAFHAIEKEQENLERSNKKVNSYIIILVDGVTTYYSKPSRLSKNFYLGDREQYSNGRRHYIVTGKGNRLDSEGEKYVRQIGNMINSNNEIKTFVIGFSNQWEDGKYVELESVNTIAKACGIGEEHHFDITNKTNPVKKENPKYIFWAKDEDSLKNIFTSISTTIEADFWQVSGPDN